MDRSRNVWLWRTQWQSDPGLILLFIHIPGHIILQYIIPGYIYITELQYGIHSMIHLFEQNDHWFYGHWTCKSFVVYWNFRGFGFVTFVDADSVEKVLDASPHHLDSKQVTNWFGQISILQQIWTEFQLGNLLYSVKVEIHLVQICHSWLPAVGVVHVWKLVCGSAKDKAGR